MPYPFVLLGIATRVKEATSEDLDFGRLKYFGKFGKSWRAAEINAFVARSRKPVSQEQIPPLIDTYKHTGVNVPDGPKLTIPLEKRRASALSPRWTPGRTKSPQPGIERPIPRAPATARWWISRFSSPLRPKPPDRCLPWKTGTASASRARDICCGCDKACRRRVAGRCR